MFRLDGSVSGWETSCEAPSRMPHSRKIEVGSFVFCSCQGMMVIVFFGFWILALTCCVCARLVVPEAVCVCCG